MSDDDKTPVDRPIANVIYRGLVRVLTNHVAMLDRVRQQVAEIRDSLEVITARPAPEQLEKLARVFRNESDSAIDAAREAEALARATRTGVGA